MPLLCFSSLNTLSSMQVWKPQNGGKVMLTVPGRGESSGELISHGNLHNNKKTH